VAVTAGDAKTSVTFGRLIFDLPKNHWVISGVKPHVALRIKDIFRRISKVATGEFVFANDDLHSHELLWFLERFPMEVSKFDLSRLRRGRKNFIKNINEAEKVLGPEFTPPQYLGIREGYAVWKEQAQAVELFRIKRHLLLGDDVGLGKTNTAIASLLDPSMLPALVIVQAHLPEQWEERIEEFSTLRPHIVKTVAPYELPSADVFIISYSKLHGWVDLFATGYFKSVIIDEPQELRNGLETEKGMAANKACINATAVMGLSATPVVNYGIDMFKVLEFIAPGLLGNQDEFVREWCYGPKNMVKDTQALGAYLREQQVLLRRTEADFGISMPPPNITTHTVEYDHDIAAQSEDLAVQLAMKATSGSFVERGKAYRDLDMLARLTTGVAKAKAVAEYVKILLDADLPVLLAGWHREVYDLWNHELRNYFPVMYTGTEGRAAKRHAKQQFVSGKSPLMFISLRSGAGLDGLQHRCRDLVVGEMDWSPTIHKQLIGRLRRNGQIDQVNAHFMIANGGSDPLLVEVLGLKASQSQGIMDPFMAPQETLNDESRMKRLAEMVLARRRSPGREILAA
jgi:SNF2 family DNA or RNA helicase